MARFFLTRKAKDDLLNIARYTEKTWGRAQRNTYLTNLDQAFQAISASPQIGKACDYIRAGYFKYAVGKHLVFYRLVDNDKIEIVRILHERMDLKLRIDESDS